MNPHRLRCGPPPGNRAGLALPTRSFRGNPDLKQLKRQARDLLKGFQDGDTEAVEEVDTHFHGADPRRFALHDAQLVIARAHGLGSWPQLVECVGSAPKSPPAEPVSRRMKTPFNMADREWLRDSVAVDADRAWDLFRGCADGNEARVRSLTADNADLLHAEVRYNKPIDFAICEGHVGIVRHLLESDTRRWLWRHVYGEISRRDVRRRGYEEMDSLLMSYKLDNAPRYTPGFERLNRAIHGRSLEGVKRILRDEEMRHASDLDGNGPLHLAVSCGAFEIVEYLVGIGVPVEETDARGATPLDLSLNTAQATSYLLANGAPAGHSGLRPAWGTWRRRKHC